MRPALGWMLGLFMEVAGFLCWAALPPPPIPAVLGGGGGLVTEGGMGGATGFTPRGLVSGGSIGVENCVGNVHMRTTSLCRTWGGLL